MAIALLLTVLRYPLYSSAGETAGYFPTAHPGGSMRKIVSRVCARALVALAAAAASVSAATAQTTVIFNDSRPDVVYATLRAGAYAKHEFSDDC